MQKSKSLSLFTLELQFRMLSNFTPHSVVQGSEFAKYYFYLDKLVAVHTCDRIHYSFGFSTLSYGETISKGGRPYKTRSTIGIGVRCALARPSLWVRRCKMSLSFSLSGKGAFSIDWSDHSIISLKC